MKKTIAAIAAAAVLSGAFGVVAPIVTEDRPAAAEEVVAGSSWSRMLFKQVKPVKDGAGDLIPLGSSWS